MASRCATVTEVQILAVNEAAIPENTKKATKFGLAIFTGTVLLFLGVRLWPEPTQYDLFTIAELLKSYFSRLKLKTISTMTSLKYPQNGFNCRKNSQLLLKECWHSNSASALIAIRVAT